MFLFTSVDRTPMDKAPSRRVTYKASVCNVVLDVHVKRYDMCMWDSTTCASRTALHVHLKQDCAPRNRADALNKLLLHMYFSYCYLIEY